MRPFPSRPVVMSCGAKCAATVSASEAVTAAIVEDLVEVIGSKLDDARVERR